MDKEQLEKLNKKRWYKLRGIVQLVEQSSYSQAVVNVLISKGSGDKKKFYYLSAFGVLAQSLLQTKKGYRIKVWFSIESKQHNERWYTNLRLEAFEHWAVNEDKLKKQQREAELLEKQQKITWGNPDFK